VARLGLIAPMLLSLLAGGCSFAFVQPPKDDGPVPRASNCTSSQIAPVVDTLFTASNLVSLGYFLATSDVAHQRVALGLGLVDMALWLSSAIYGYYNTNRCRELIREAEDGSFNMPIHFRQLVPPAEPDPPPPPVPLTPRFGN
jgi:hypothetical protein